MASHWQEWLEAGLRDDVMLGAFLGDEEARRLVPGIPPCPDSLQKFVEALRELPWTSRELASRQHVALVRAAVALGRAAIPLVRKRKNAEGAEMHGLYTTEAWVVHPHPMVAEALDRLLYYSAPPSAPLEIQLQDQVAEVVLDPDAISRTVKSGGKVLGKREALACIVRELRAFAVDRQDPVCRSIGDRLFLSFLLDEGPEDAVRVERFPDEWRRSAVDASAPAPADRTLVAVGSKRYDLVPNAAGLLLASDALKAFLEREGLALEYLEVTVGGTRSWWVRPRETYDVLDDWGPRVKDSWDSFTSQDVRHLRLDAEKCRRAPALFFVAGTRFVCGDHGFFHRWREAGLAGSFGVVLPFGAPLRH